MIFEKLGQRILFFINLLISFFILLVFISPSEFIHGLINCLQFYIFKQVYLFNKLLFLKQINIKYLWSLSKWLFFQVKSSFFILRYSHLVFI